jgi:hypothetical protein
MLHEKPICGGFGYHSGSQQQGSIRVLKWYRCVGWALLERQLRWFFMREGGMKMMRAGLDGHVTDLKATTTRI